jgi:RimJ/RimL family protein N-acetyltransferase
MLNTDGVIPLVSHFEGVEGPRVRLRLLRREDVPTMFAILSDPVVTRYWSNPPMVDVSEAEAWLERRLQHYSEGNAFQMGVERKADGALLGTCSLFELHAECRRAEVGYLLAKEFWGQGLMTEALGALIERAFGPLNLNRLEADIDPRNLASAKLLKRMGFQEEGILRERWIVAGEVSDTAFYGLLRSDWSYQCGRGNENQKLLPSPGVLSTPI